MEHWSVTIDHPEDIFWIVYGFTNNSGMNSSLHHRHSTGISPKESGGGNPFAG